MFFFYLNPLVFEHFLDFWQNKVFHLNQCKIKTNRKAVSADTESVTDSLGHCRLSMREVHLSQKVFDMDKTYLIWENIPQRL